MEKETVENNAQNKSNQKGAALITVLLMMMLLLTASAGLLLESSQNSYNASDALSEQQAYVAAESGIQAAVNVLRQSPPNPFLFPPSPLLNSDATSATYIDDNTLDYIKASKPAFSNNPDDTSSVCRLSRWLNYNYSSDGTTMDRVTMDSTNYTAATGFGYSVEVMDPDYTGDTIIFSTDIRINNVLTNSSTVDGLTIEYAPRATTTVSMPTGSATTDMGSFTLSIGAAASITLTDNITFEIREKMTSPYEMTKVIRGYIRKGTITSLNLSSTKIYFISPVYEIGGSTFTMSSINKLDTDTTTTTDDEYYILYGATGGLVAGTMTPIEPIRLKITSTGYGPRYAVKKLEAIIQKNFLNNLGAPTPLLLIGPNSNAYFHPGSSTVAEYSGVDVQNTNVIVPSVGTSNDDVLETVNLGFEAVNNRPDVTGAPANVSDEIPDWLESAEALDNTIKKFEEQSTTKIYDPDVDTVPSIIGDYTTGSGVTIIKGDYEIGPGDHGGILFVTGKLTFHGDFSFKGLIVVTGTDGADRRGAGNGEIQGNLVIAPYDPDNLAGDSTTVNGFKSPRYDMRGGGTGAVKYDSDSLNNGLAAASNFVIGVVEK